MMRVKAPHIILGLLVIAIATGCSKAAKDTGKTAPVPADGMADSAATAAADLAKKPEPEAQEK